MKTKTFRKLSPLFLGLSLASTSAFAGELTYFKSEVKWNGYEEGYQKVEGTVALGSYKINDTFKFNFDVDRDYVVHTSESAAKEGWDTSFTLSQKAGKVANADLQLNYKINYDQSQEVHNDANSTYSVAYIGQAILDFDLDSDYYFSVEFWAQGGVTDGGDLQDDSGAETNFYFGGDISDNWSFDLAWYDFYYYNENEEYKLQLGTENYLNYSLPLTDNFSFMVESYFEAYYMFGTEAKQLYSHIKPILKYQTKVGEKYSVHATIGFDAVKFTKLSGSDAELNEDNELEVAVGFSF